MSCFSEVEQVIKEASKQFAPIFEIDASLEDILYQYCDAIDVIGAEVGTEGFCINIDEISMKISIGVICPEFTVKHNYKMLCELVSRSIEFSVERAEDDDDEIVVTFVFPPIWKRSL